MANKLQTFLLITSSDAGFFRRLIDWLGKAYAEPDTTVITCVDAENHLDAVSRIKDMYTEDAVVSVSRSDGMTQTGIDKTICMVVERLMADRVYATLTDAASEHAENDTAVEAGDLQIALRRSIEIMSSSQREELLRSIKLETFEVTS